MSAGTSEQRRRPRHTAARSDLDPRADDSVIFCWLFGVMVNERLSERVRYVASAAAVLFKAPEFSTHGLVIELITGLSPSEVLRCLTELEAAGFLSRKKGAAMEGESARLVAWHMRLDSHGVYAVDEEPIIHGASQEAVEVT